MPRNEEREISVPTPNGEPDAYSAKIEDAIEEPTETREGKSKKEKNGKAEEPTIRETAEDDTSTPSKKRKRGTTVEEIEIDINAPEPPSKKTLRKLKKSGATSSSTSGSGSTRTTGNALTALTTAPATAPKPEKFPEHASQSRSKWGVWIGNLAFSVAKADLETFFTKPPSTIPRIGITRINLPTNPQTRRNKGFAYVDFSSQESLNYALTLTENLWNGRPVLIKDAKDFSSRTSTPAVKLGADLSKNAPSRILWVGNLDFTTKEEDLAKHFAFAGKIVKVRLTTFEDTGKCKGFGFVDFEDEESVKRAMLGLSPEDQSKLDILEGKEEEGLDRLRKKRGFIGSRRVKMEYGEDPSVRYKKRFGKESGARDNEDVTKGAPVALMGSRGRLTATGGVGEQEKDTKPSGRRSKFDNPKRPSNPGAAYSNDSRRTGAITESKGKRVKFD
ncbi:hypothetical protein C7212DRAFT_352817 [Tuber magnatum]|uniref:RRM domain-containing protein n=1 Tax=Tuber magnatum TaxID=42249 RepID=A0A317SL76_9PEZI|nr:hypothetical protein C7212DRAFT_352817 [Tuber magnatum]